ncbi:MAG TPA: NAD(P)/FAD-dependent oxidoreductase [Desulfohalobiaceae bacterium]|nr:NAD(P)/FAD-dependent oxidoreductase [Desulfohalobiaceae bacterium]
MLKDGDKGAILQRDKETYAIAPHLPCGVVKPEQLRKLADVAEKYNCAAMKVTSAARIALVGLKEEDIDKAWEDLGLSPGAAVGVCVRSVKACPGTTFCRLGMQDSLSMGMELDKKYHGLQLPGKLKIGVSGCQNQCAETCIKDIALVGGKKGWTVMAGGSGAKKPRLADVIAEELSDDQALGLIERIIDYYRDNANKNERMGKMMDRLGVDSFRSAVTS